MMYSPIAFCSHCKDEFVPVEYVTVPVDPDEPRFCSDFCETRAEGCEALGHTDLDACGACPDCEQACHEARRTGAPLH